MNKNNSFKEIWEAIQKSKNILLTLHYGPDGDSLGCCAAMKYVLEKQLNKKVTLVSKDLIDEEFNLINFVNEVEFGKGLDEIDLSRFDLILFLDSGVISMFSGRDNSNFVIPKNVSTINIDHHHTNDYFAQLNYVNSKRPSACSVLIDLFREIGIKFDEELATRLLLGVYTDSGFFSHDNGQSIKDADFLIDHGARYLEIVNAVRYNVPLNVKRYFVLLTNNFKVKEIEGYKIGYSRVSQREIKKLSLNLSEIRGGINYLQEIGGIDVLFTLAEMEDNIKGSFRTRKNIDVSLFAKELGGGGHKMAAAFKLSKISLEKAENLVFEIIKKKGFNKIN